MNEKLIDREITVLKNVIKQNQNLTNFDELHQLHINKIKSFVFQNAHLISKNLIDF